MHPIERLRHVARAHGAGPSAIGRAAADALAGFADDPQGLVTACQRLVERHPSSGTVWWLAARVLAGADPRTEAWTVADELDADPTVELVADALPAEAAVVTIGYPELTFPALRRRADVTVLSVDVDLPAAGVAAAVDEADLVLVEADALGPDALLAALGSRPAAAVAKLSGKPVWAVAGVGRVLPEQLWRAAIDHVGLDEPAWERDVEVLSLRLVDRVIEPADRVGCPVAPELLRGSNLSRFS